MNHKFSVIIAVIFCSQVLASPCEYEYTLEHVLKVLDNIIDDLQKKSDRTNIQIITDNIKQAYENVDNAATCSHENSDALVVYLIKFEKSPAGEILKNLQNIIKTITGESVVLFVFSNIRDFALTLQETRDSTLSAGVGLLKRFGLQL